LEKNVKFAEAGAPRSPFGYGGWILCPQTPEFTLYTLCDF